jgi:hypothetical protein
MRKLPPLALLAAGKVTDFGILGIAAVRERLGPVKASSLRVASRMVNQIRAGHAVAGFDEFAKCRTILVCVPESKLTAAVQELALLDLDWRRKTVLLCNDWTPDCRQGEPLQRLGASAGVLLELGGEARPLYLLDGDARALREARKLFSGAPVNLIALTPGSKLSLLAALQCAGPLLYSLLRAGMECLQHTGLPAQIRGSLLQRSFARTLRAHLNAGKKTQVDLRGIWDAGVLDKQITPQLAMYLDQATLSASQYLSRR